MTSAFPRIVATVFAIIVPSLAWAQSASEPDGYRQEPYQAAVPATLRGAAALSTEDARVLWAEGRASFIDVLPHPPKPAGLPAGTIWMEKPHSSIRGAVWLPEVGRGALSAETEDYYRMHLASITAGNREKTIVIFCKRNCWMSWNAARRAQTYGYGKVFWYADGVDGWADAGLPLEPVKPQS